MISEGSCDTEDWSNDAENSALITEINYILKYKTSILNCNNISQYYCLLNFWSNKYSHDKTLKNIKNLSKPFQTFEH